jgi:hypothetical protein
MIRRPWETKRNLILESNKRILGESKEQSDFDLAVNFCKTIEEWWKESDNLVFYADKESEYAKFFCPYQDTWDDDDPAAAKAYERKVMHDLNKEIKDDNTFYPKIVDWIKRIVDEIDDSFQNIQEIELVNEEEGVTKYFKVDPEIDVSKCKESEK